MAEFLIKRTNAIHKDPVEDKRGCYKRGDVVQVYEDRECKESPSPNSKMYIIKVSGMKKEEAMKYIEGEVRDDGLDENGWPILTTIRRRKYYLDFTSLGSEIVNDLNTKREATVTIIQAENSLKLKV